jgi:hypothetical protein
MNVGRSWLVGAFAVAAIGCTHIARVEDLPTSASQVPFDAAARMGPRGDGVWTQDTNFEHYIEVSPAALEGLHKRLEEALVKAGYQLTRSDGTQAAIIASRGLTMMEWGSVVAIYYRPEPVRTQVYVRVHITQDITGSPKHNPAWDVGDEVCKEVGFCKVRK